jgi:hypothetical protein
MYRFIPLFALIVVSLMGRVVLAENSEPQLLVWELEQLQASKAALKNPTTELSRAADQLKRHAEESLKHQSYSVTYNDFVPPSGDKHDYVSFGAYWWPDPTKPDGLPYIRRDGETNREQRSLGDKDNLSAFLKDVETLSLAYFLFDDERYAQHAINLLNDWFLNPDTRMNPHLDYAQAVLGRNHGKSTGIIDTRDFIYVLESMELLKSSPAYTPEFAEGMRNWFADFFQWLQTSEHGQKESSALNNHGAWYQAQAMRIALYLQEEDFARQLLKHVQDNLIPAQIQADGTQPHELARTNSFHYSIFNLHALGTIARMAESLNEDLWHEKGQQNQGMQAASLFLLPYVAGDEPWPHQQISKYEVSPRVNEFLRMLSVRYQEPRWLDVSANYRKQATSFDYSPFVAAGYSKQRSANE